MPKGKGSGAGVKRPSVSKSTKAGLLLPVSRINKTMKATSTIKRVGQSAPVYATAVLEYIMTEIIDLAGRNTVRAKPKRKRITPEDISMAIRTDPSLAKLCRGIAMYSGDKLQITPKMLEPKDNKGKDGKEEE